MKISSKCTEYIDAKFLGKKKSSTLRKKYTGAGQESIKAILSSVSLQNYRYVCMLYYACVPYASTGTYLLHVSRPAHTNMNFEKNLWLYKVSAKELIWDINTIIISAHVLCTTYLKILRQTPQIFMFVWTGPIWACTVYTVHHIYEQGKILVIYRSYKEK